MPAGTGRNISPGQTLASGPKPAKPQPKSAELLAGASAYGRESTHSEGPHHDVPAYASIDHAIISTQAGSGVPRGLRYDTMMPPASHDPPARTTGIIGSTSSAPVAMAAYRSSTGDSMPDLQPLPAHWQPAPRRAPPAQASISMVRVGVLV